MASGRARESVWNADVSFGRVGYGRSKGREGIGCTEYGTGRSLVGRECEEPARCAAACFELVA